MMAAREQFMAFEITFHFRLGKNFLIVSRKLTIKSLRPVKSCN